MRHRSEADHRHRPVAACVLSSPCWPPASGAAHRSSTGLGIEVEVGAVIEHTPSVSPAPRCTAIPYLRPHTLTVPTFARSSSAHHRCGSRRRQERGGAAAAAATADAAAGKRRSFRSSGSGSGGWWWQRAAAAFPCRLPSPSTGHRRRQLSTRPTVGANRGSRVWRAERESRSWEPTVGADRGSRA